MYVSKRLEYRYYFRQGLCYLADTRGGHVEIIYVYLKELVGLLIRFTARHSESN